MKTAVMLCSLLVLVTASTASAQTPVPSLERGPYLQRTTPTSVVIRWRTDVATSSRVLVGTAPDALADSTVTPQLTTEHEVEILGREPDTRYYYAIGTDSAILAGGDDEHSFKTSPPSGTSVPTRIWVVGDSGKCGQSGQGCEDAAAVRDRYVEYAGSNLADLWLMLGDNAYPSGSDASYTQALFQVYPEILRNTPLWPVPGNHEFGDSDSASQSGPYYEAFTLPTRAEAGGVVSGTEAYYSFDYGNIHFIALDSHDTDRSVDGSMYAWLEADLMSMDADWVIVSWHHPPYSKGDHDSDNPFDSGGRLRDMRENFVPLLESYGVDLQLAGHNHMYERSMLIDGHHGTSDEFDPALHALDAGDGDPAWDGAYRKATLGAAPHEGAVYSIVGSSSSNESQDFPKHPVMITTINYEGSMVIDIDDEVLEAVFIDKDGVIGDRFSIVKGQGGADTDTDGDLVPDDMDNCSTRPNGANEKSNQIDSDRDGYGNACDPDYNNDFGVTADDFGVFLSSLGGPGGGQADHDGDGVITVLDFGHFVQFLGEPPGTSGLSCAGQPNCEAGSP